MKETIDAYNPQPTLMRMQKQARKVWIASSIVIFLWVFAIVLAPVAKLYQYVDISAPLFTFFGYICHQISDRSFHIAGEQFAVCSRCFGVYFGLLTGFVIYPLWRPIDAIEPLPRFWLFLSLVPISIDWSLTIFGIWENTHSSRFLTGLILGAACATFIMPALVEITRNLSFRKTPSRA